VSIPVGDMAIAAITPPLSGLFWGMVTAIFPWVGIRFLMGWICSAAVMTGEFALLDHEWLPAGVGAANLLLAIFFWLRNRRKRRRSPKAFGAKSRARLAALVRSMRETRPRPVLRPVPQGS
jgi:high-affinity Fe2+/Pb2+ permease